MISLLSPTRRPPSRTPAHGAEESYRATGPCAPIFALARDQGSWRVTDCLGATIEIPERLRPELCLRAGVVHQADSSLLVESTADVA
jgi:hypothetical protein